MGTLLMSRKERRRLVVLSQVQEEKISLVKAAELLGLCYRQMKRVWSRHQCEGDDGVVHRLRGRRSNRQAELGVKKRALQLYQEKYRDYGVTLAAECLAEEDELAVPVSTLRRWLLGAKLWERKRTWKPHRRRRARKEHYGELVQMDGSYHDWFEGRRGWAVLMVMIDDATGRVFARFFENESWQSAATMFRGYVWEHGLPRGLYVDQHGIYRADREANRQEILAGKEPQTQFGRAMVELGVELILARSAQAKGRVERMNGTLQDRLVKALRRLKIRDLKAANAYLEKTFLSKFNARFEVPAAKAANVHQALPDDCDLGRVLSIQEERVVYNDWTVRWKNGFLQLEESRGTPVRPKKRVTVCETLEGTLRLFLGDRELTWSAVRTRPQAQRKKPSRRPGDTIRSHQGQRPSAGHPWRKRLLGEGR
jgi:molybdenum-dependent DNA-binding transcriptional regulator ModE